MILQIVTAELRQRRSNLMKLTLTNATKEAQKNVRQKIRLWGHETLEVYCMAYAVHLLAKMTVGPGGVLISAGQHVAPEAEESSTNRQCRGQVRPFEEIPTQLHSILQCDG